MEAYFWHERWQNNEIGFHKLEANPLLVKYFNRLSLMKGRRIFLPLCGKTLDIPWLLSQGYRVAGAELSKIAVEQLFAELGVEPQISEGSGIDHYRAMNIDIWVGDICDVTSTMLGRIDAIYDRAALVALPEKMRPRYTAHLMEITQKAPQLLITYEYDQRMLNSPPFSISREEVHTHYRNTYALSLIAKTGVSGGLKGTCPAYENVWVLRNVGAQTSLLFQDERRP